MLVLTMASGRTASGAGAGAPAGGPAGSKPHWHEDTSAQLSKIQWRPASTPQLQQKDRATASVAVVEWGPVVQEKHTGRGKDAFATGKKATKRPLAGDGDRDSDSGGGGKEDEDRDGDGSSPPPVDAFKLLGARDKQVWVAKRPRSADGNRGGCTGGKFDGDGDGDDRIVGQGSAFSTVPSRGVKPNAAKAASLGSTHGYFTRSASAEIVAGAGAPGVPNAAQAASPRSTHGYFTRSASTEIVASLDEFLRIL